MMSRSWSRRISSQTSNWISTRTAPHRGASAGLAATRVGRASAGTLPTAGWSKRVGFWVSITTSFRQFDLLVRMLVRTVGFELYSECASFEYAAFPNSVGTWVGLRHSTLPIVPEKLRPGQSLYPTEN